MDKKERGQIAAAIRYYEEKGHPEKATPLYRALHKGTDFDRALLMPEATTTKPEKAVASISDLVAPSRYGQGSSTDAWRKFLRDNSTIEPAVLNAMKRNELIEIAEDRGIIPRAEPTG